MRLLLVSRDGTDFYQIDTEDLTQDLLDKIDDNDFTVIRLNEEVGVFQELNLLTRNFESVDYYEDDADKVESRRELLTLIHSLSK